MPARFMVCEQYSGCLPAVAREASEGGCTLHVVRVLGIDFGAKRIGLALSDATGLLASPWKTVDGGPPVAAAARIGGLAAELVREDDGLDAIVVGLPRRLDGSDNNQTPIVRTFAAELARVTSLPVILQDERLSSHEAESRLAVRERDWRKRKAKLDAAAAAVILQDYLDTEGGQCGKSPDGC